MSDLTTIKHESGTEVTTEMKAVLEASYALSIEEQRILFLAIIEARKQGNVINVEDKISINYKTYMRIFNTDKPTARKNLLKGGMDLFEKHIEYKELDDEGNECSVKCRWLSSIGVTKTEDYFEIFLGMGCGVTSSMNALRRRYEVHGLKQVSGLYGAYALRLYDMLIQWKYIGKTSTFPIENLREQLGLTDEYPAMSDFKKRVLDLAVSRINEHTDIEVSYEQRKKGRLITGFIFKVKAKAGEATKPRAIVRDANTSDMFTESEFTDKQLMEIAANPDFKADYIGLVDTNHPAYHSTAEWQFEMVSRMKDNASQFDKRPLEEYLI